MRKHAMARLSAAILASTISLLAAPALAQETADAVQSNVTPTIMQLRRAFLDPNFNAVTFRSLDEVFATRTVPHGGPVWRLPRNDHALNFTYEVDGVNPRTPEEFFDRTYTNAVLIIKDGLIVYESYRNGGDERDRFIGFSMTKSITSVLIGCALAEGRIRSLDDRVDRYLPELRNSAYRGVTIRQILRMRSGVDRPEDYSDPNFRARMTLGSPDSAMTDNINRYANGALEAERAYPPGSRFNYLNLDTAVLGWLLERVSGGNTIAGYATQRLWEPLGAEADGFFIMDGEPGVGREFNVAGFNATLRDWGRFGQMMLNGGQANGRQVVSREWVEESTRQFGNDAENGWGYGYQWWTVDDTDAYAARGLGGQTVFIQPSTRTVIVKLSYYPPAVASEGGSTLQRESTAFFLAASAWSPEGR